MPIVAEIMNARGQQEAMDVVHQFEGNGDRSNQLSLVVLGASGVNTKRCGRL
jgi:hypothetical protein